MNELLILIGKLVSSFSKSINKGSGSTWPGHVALNLNKNFIKDILANNPHLKVILIAGTNGKTTTAKLLRFILEKKGLKVFQNESGANLLNGIASTLIKNASTTGKILADVAIFEIDENTLPLILKEIEPAAIILLNLFRDQLDRYGEVNTIAKKWIQALAKLSNRTHLITNGDDPQLYFVGKTSHLPISYFGIDEKLMEKKEIPHDVDSIYCPNCNHKLQYKKIAYSHLGNFLCTNCDFKHPNTNFYSQSDTRLEGTYNLYNANAAIITAEKIFDVNAVNIKDDLKEFIPAFGRQEEITYQNKKIKILLSKNPTGFNQSIESILKFDNNKNKSFSRKRESRWIPNPTDSAQGRQVRDDKKLHVLLVLNDRIPDGRDVSWIWDVDFEQLVKKSSNLTISGDRVFDMALRIKYCSSFHGSRFTFHIKEILTEAISFAIEQTPSEETLYILPTYSAMLDVRKILTGKKIL